MKQKEFLLVVGIYSLIIAAGHSGPLLKKIEKMPWNQSVDFWVRDLSQEPIPYSNPAVQKALLASRVRQILAPNSPVPESVMAQDSIRQKLEEKWKRMAADPAGLGIETEPAGNISAISGNRPGVKATPSIPEGRPPHEGETTKG